MRRLVRVVLVTAAGLLPGRCAADAGPVVDYARDLQPIFTRACVSCHGPEKQRNGLRLDTALGLREGGDSGPAIVPGASSQSRIYHAISGTNAVKLMPPNWPRLAAAEIEQIKAWIDRGAKFPAEEMKAARGKVTHWAFQPITPPPVPLLRNPHHAVHNPIDSFILARLEKAGLEPAPEADRLTLLRRLALDLTGLPPTPDEVDAFVKDPRPDAYQRQVDRLLGSPHYGERWGRYWLDLARYADSNGYSIDSPRTIWPFRDWVISALNQDMPFDRFTIEQLAGDLLPDATTDQQIATGFHRNTQINEEGGVDKEQFRVEAVFDRVNTTGSVWLGLTLGCAQCHSHKYDPLSQREYYQLLAFFNNQDEPNLPATGPSPTPLPQKKKPGLTTMILRERPTPRPTYVLRGGDFTRPGASVGPGTPAVLPPLWVGGEGGSRVEDRRSRIEDRTAGDPPLATPNRLDLARWLVRPDHPLTARVTVNRVWAHYFGVGLVETENDFGTRGTPPSHPELLDWLASEFVRRGWSLKALHRLIVTSATYRQSSQARADLEGIDPRNRLLARQTRLRLEAEVIRDLALAASGLLHRRIGGPSVFPPQPDGIYKFTQVQRAWKTSTGPDRYRRGLYTFFQRSAPYPALTVFDAPDASSACTRRGRSNTPLQTLTLLNDQGFLELAQGLADRVLREAPRCEQERLRYAFRVCLARPPSPVEAKRLEQYLRLQLSEFRAAPAAAHALLTGVSRSAPQVGGAERVDSALGPSVAERAAWTSVARILLNLDEFITRE
jgi:mono/diheme cytochrome c family protein